MTKSSFPIVVWVLLGVLVIAAGTLSLGRNDTRTLPSASSYTPSGTKAFADLLANSGYHVQVTQAAKPKLAPQGVLVAFSVNSQLAGDSRSFINDFVDAGGKAAIFVLPANFPTAPDAQPSGSNATTAQQVEHFDAPGSYKVDTRLASNAAFDTDSNHMFTIARTDSGPVAQLRSLGAGRMLIVTNGIIATNRFIDRNQNAEEALRLFRAIAPEGSSVVFMEASFGHVSEPSVLERIGAWALVAWWQLLFLFIVIVYTLGKPFGYPDEERPRQGGARDLVDAVAQTFRRARATHVAMRSMSKEADSEIRKKLKLPLSATRADRDRLLPDSLSNALARVQVAGDDRIGIYDALALARKLDTEMAQFLGERVNRYRRRKYG